MELTAVCFVMKNEHVNQAAIKTFNKIPQLAGQYTIYTSCQYQEYGSQNGNKKLLKYPSYLLLHHEERIF